MPLVCGIGRPAPLALRDRSGRSDCPAGWSEELSRWESGREDIGVIHVRAGGAKAIGVGNRGGGISGTLIWRRGIGVAAGEDTTSGWHAPPSFIPGRRAISGQEGTLAQRLASTAVASAKTRDFRTRRAGRGKPGTPAHRIAVISPWPPGLMFAGDDGWRAAKLVKRNNWCHCAKEGVCRACRPRGGIYLENKRSGIHRGGSMRDGRARRGKMVQGRRGVGPFSALVRSPVRTPRCPRPRVSYRRDGWAATLFAVFDARLWTTHSRAIFARIIRRRCWRRADGTQTAAAGGGHGAGPLQRAWPGRASPSARLHVHNFVLRGGCRLRAASASRLPLSPGHPRTSPGNCARCSPAACVEGGLLSTDASLAVRPSPGLVGRPAISDRPSSLLSATLPACEPASDSLLSCPAGSCRTSCESPLFPGIPPSAIGHPERVLQDGALTRSAHPPPPKS